MFQPKVIVRLALLGLLGLLPLSLTWGGTFTVTIKPTNGGTVTWHTEDSPSVTRGEGTFSGTGGSFPFTMNLTRIMLVFHPNPSGSIQTIVSDEGNEMPYLSYGNSLFWSGPSENSKKVTVTFSGGTPVTPVDPTGNFPLTFPSSNPALTPIIDLTGEYKGVSPFGKPRAYDIIVAQDESGKLIISGTVEGISTNKIVKAANTSSLPAHTSFLPAYNIGQITTVGTNPTVKIKGSFNGSIDGTNSASVSGAGQAPLVLAPIPSKPDSNVIYATGSYVAKENGVPIHLLPTSGPIPIVVSKTEAALHIHKAWSISLSINNKVNAKTHKPYIGATSVLTRPLYDGTEVITFPEQIVKYSKAGYKLTLKGGTNTTTITGIAGSTSKPNKKSTITITGMTLTKTGSVWNPTAGKLSYQFLGQKGTGDLMLFIEP